MIKHLLAPLIFTSLILTGCQSPQGKFTPEQVAAMQSYGFTESAGDWSLGLSDAILFAKNDYKLLPESQQQIQTMAAKLASTGLTHARMDGHTDNYGEDSYNEVLSLKRANVVADAWAMGGQIPRSNLTTQGLGKKYPIASNKTAQGRAENRRVAVVITTLKTRANRQKKGQPIGQPFLTGCRLSEILVKTLFDTSSLTSTLTQVVQFSFTNSTTTFDRNAVNYRRVSLKTRSTPSPLEILRTVNAECRPRLRIAITTPSNACRRFLEPSTTHTFTSTVSPGRKEGTSCFICSCSSCLIMLLII